MSQIKLSVVCTDDSADKFSRIVTAVIDKKTIEKRVIETVEQKLAAGVARELHNAAHHAEHGPVTYLQQIHAGGFSVFVGPPDKLTESYFDTGSYVAFMDDVGPGHASKVGPDGVQRTMRVLKGHLDL